MNDTTIKTSSSLVLTAEFTDEDTRTITQDNPRSDITAADIASIQSAAQNVLIGDKTGAEFARLKTPFIRNTTTTEIIFN